MEWPAIQASYTGKLAGPDRIEGSLTQGAVLPLVFLRGEAGLAAATPPPAPIAALTDASLEQIRADAGLPALAAAASRLGGGTMDWATGERALGSGVKVTKTDRWHLGSITKSMTATLVARLVEAGKVSWTDTVGATLGAAAPQMRAEYRDVNFLHLLSHRSGLPGNLPGPELMAFKRENPDPRAERLEYARKALAQTPSGPKESHFEYSNSGFILAGAMLEVKLGDRWEELIRKHLFAPLGLASAGFGAPDAKDDLSQPVGHGPGATSPLAPYRASGGVTDNPAVLGPAGRVHMRLSEVLKYLAAHRDRSDLLKPASWDRLHTPPFGGDYALGWVVRAPGVFWHNGSNTLWYAEVSFNTNSKVVAAAASNDGRTDKAGPAVGRALASAMKAVSAA
jgi:CubicO group peptidase (beta-lactamase class C family)